MPVSCPSDVTFWDVWSLWLSDVTVSDCILWGKTIRSLGRAGKIAQFIAAMAIIAEIVGPERIRKTGEGLRRFGDVMSRKFPWLFKKRPRGAHAHYLILFIVSIF